MKLWLCEFLECFVFFWVAIYGPASFFFPLFFSLPFCAFVRTWRGIEFLAYFLPRQSANSRTDIDHAKMESKGSSIADVPLLAVAQKPKGTSSVVPNIFIYLFIYF
jgi:hypothetical protein